MAPSNPRKRKSDEMEEAVPAGTTPTGSPTRKKMKISQQQKQALIDNLQLESMRTIMMPLAYTNTFCQSPNELANSAPATPFNVPTFAPASNGASIAFPSRSAK
jgi:hypothetical protein